MSALANKSIIKSVEQLIKRCSTTSNKIAAVDNLNGMGGNYKMKIKHGGVMHLTLRKMS